MCVCVCVQERMVVEGEQGRKKTAVNRDDERRRGEKKHNWENVNEESSKRKRVEEKTALPWAHPASQVKAKK